MSYEKKYLPVNSDIKEEWDEREDRVGDELLRMVGLNPNDTIIKRENYVSDMNSYGNNVFATGLYSPTTVGRPKDSHGVFLHIIPLYSNFAMQIAFDSLGTYHIRSKWDGNWKGWKTL